MKNISDLLDVDLNIKIKGITDDSRKVSSGYLFVATKGFNVDHYDYIKDAIEKGCVFFITDREVDINFPHKVVKNINSVYKELCKKFYDIDFSKHKFIGITGTDGKTTTATIVSRLIDGSSYIGTNGLTISGETTSTSNTTPCIEEMYKDLKKIEDANSLTTVMEVSSEALLHDRVSNFKYSIVAFTNVTGDHLDIHGGFKNYLDTKLKLLDLVEKDGIVIANGDDSNLNKIECRNIYKFGFNNDNDFIIRDVTYNDENVLIELEYDNNKIVIDSPLKGKYNVYNVVLAFIIGYFYGVDISLLLDRIKELSPIKGRCEIFKYNNFDIVLDYAHTINGISSILDAFSNYDNIITVTGCAGGRDKEKRSVIGKMIMDKSNISIFTMDDPRYENVDDIIDDMVGDNKDYIRIVDRVEAINYALSIASSGSVVLILGKGRDDYMAIGDKKVKYCDYEVINNFIENGS